MRRFARTPASPLVFIIDELDRCRPTFAIELLERVKHIFDVPNIVFVFGINRDELTKSLVSVYGEIEAGEYLRRFFDMEFILPERSPTRFCLPFCSERYLVDRILSVGLSSSMDLSNQRIATRSEHQLVAQIPALDSSWLRWACHLRDMDYCVRLLGALAEGLDGRRQGVSTRRCSSFWYRREGSRIPTLYRRFIEGGSARGGDLLTTLNYIVPLRTPRAPVTDCTRSRPSLTLRWSATTRGRLGATQCSWLRDRWSAGRGRIPS